MKKEAVKGHQGDVQFRQLSGLPKGARPINHKPIALGEHSGHQHVLTGDVQLFEHEGRMLAAVGSDGAQLQHVHETAFAGKAYSTRETLTVADHKPVPLKEGVYEFFIQNAYNPFKKLMEKVID